VEIGGPTVVVGLIAMAGLTVGFTVGLTVGFTVGLTVGFAVGLTVVALCRR